MIATIIIVTINIIIVIIVIICIIVNNSSPPPSSSTCFLHCQKREIRNTIYPIARCIFFSAFTSISIISSNHRSPPFSTQKHLLTLFINNQDLTPVTQTFSSRIKYIQHHSKSRICDTHP